MLTLVIIEKLVHLVSNNWCLKLKFQGQLLFFNFKLWRHNTLSSSLDNRDLIQNIHDPFFKSPAGLRPSLRYTVIEEEYSTISVLCRTTQWWVCYIGTIRSKLDSTDGQILYECNEYSSLLYTANTYSGMTAEWQRIVVISLMWHTWKNCNPGNLH